SKKTRRVRYLDDPRFANARRRRATLLARVVVWKFRPEMSTIAARLPLYAKLMRFDRPVGTLLLLWPTLAALWVASAGKPSASLLVIFTLGTFVMRAAGCVINDWADRRFDSRVERTRERPLATGSLNEIEALVLFCALLAFGFLLVLFLNPLSQWMAVAG